MQPTTTYELSLVKEYVSHWGMKEAVRELIQNALDSASPFVYEFSSGEDGLWTLRLNSEFSALSPQSLLLGATSKAKDSDAIGSFGEGYKIALLVLTRLGYETGILNNDKLWKPKFRFNRNYGCEVLVVEETALPNKVNRGLTFMVQGLTDEDKAAALAKPTPVELLSLWLKNNRKAMRGAAIESFKKKTSSLASRKIGACCKLVSQPLKERVNHAIQN
jgi:hypothetical protein